MGAPKQKWTAEEEEALRAGVRKHGPSKWVSILKDPDFAQILSTRSNIDLKDKWRNISVSAIGQGSRDKIKMPKLKALTYPMPSQSPVASSPQSVGPSTIADHTENPEVKKDPPRYGFMILEALSALKDPNGTEISAIFNYIEQRHAVPSNFRRLLSSKLRRLVGQNKIEKGLKGYKLKESSSGKFSAPRQKDPVNRPRVSQASVSAKYIDPIEEAARTAAYKIADAEAKAFLASEAIKEAEKISKMAEESDSLLQLAKEIHQRCMQGESYQIA